MIVPVQNIYYLLSYAWNKLEECDRVAVQVVGETDLVNLLAKVLYNASKLLLKRGLDKAYLERRHEVIGIKGKLDLSETLKRNLLSRQRTSCIYDNFSPNVLTNQILVSTLRRLLQTNNLERGIKVDIRKLLLMFPPIETIPLRKAHFQGIRLHRNNQFYDFVLKVCELIYDHALPSQNPGEYHFADFRRDEVKMRMLFEKFLFNFYRHEQREYQVKSERLNWQFEAMDDSSAEYLPSLNTDISLFSKQRKIIIDAKFYKETLTTGRFNNQRVRSAHLYQLFSYLIQQENPADSRTLSTKGILLYPQTTESVHLQYRYQEHYIEVRTVNLRAGWREIKADLLAIIDHNE